MNLRDLNGGVVLRRQVSTQPDKVLEVFEQLTGRCTEHGCGFWAIVEVCGFSIPSSIVQQQRRLTKLRKDARASHGRSVNQINHILRHHNL